MTIYAEPKKGTLLFLGTFFILHIQDMESKSISGVTSTYHLQYVHQVAPDVIHVFLHEKVIRRSRPTMNYNLSSPPPHLRFGSAYIIIQLLTYVEVDMECY